MSKRLLYILIVIIIVLASTAIFAYEHNQQKERSIRPLYPIIPGAERLRVNNIYLLIPDGDSSSSLDFKWSPDGTTLAFLNNNARIEIIQSDGSGRRLLTNDQVVTGISGPNFAWSLDNKEIAYVTWLKIGSDYLSLVKSVDIKDKSTKTLWFDPNKGLIGSIVSSLLWEYSSQGKRVSCVILTKEGHGYRYHRINSPWQLNTEKTPQLYSPNKILFYHKETNNLWAIDENGRQAQITHEEDIFEYAVSPDGSKVVYSIGDQLFAVDADGKSRKSLGKGNNPSWAPDSKKIIYQDINMDEEGHVYTASDLYVINADGTGKTRLTYTPNILEFSPAWSPDGKKIAYRPRKEGKLYILTLTW